MNTSHYETLTAHERFQLLVEAMARRDEVECDRLEDSCPTRVYRCEDADFRERVRRAYSITLTVCLNMRAGLARIRMAQTFKRTSRHFADPVAKLAAAAYLCGRAQGREEARGDPGPLPSDEPDAVKKIKTERGVREQLDEIRSVAEEVVAEVAAVLCYAVGKADAVDLLSQWEGFGRFCRSRLGLEPSAAVAAFGLPNVDVQEEMKTVCAGAQANEDNTTYWEQQWSRGWDRRFGH
jgi:hypothetical protein